MNTYPKICASVAGNPSPLGVKMHNAGYSALNLDYTYIALGASNIEEAINAFKQLNIQGMGVSMPFKQSVINYLDSVDVAVNSIGACNTIVRKDEKLIGYNTDWIGAQEAINEVIDINTIRKAVIIGSGGVARAIAYALKFNGIDVYISARNQVERRRLVNDLQLSGETDLINQGQYNAELVVNATPDSTSNGPVNLDLHPNCRVVFDVIFNELMTDLTINATKKNLLVVSGWRMLLHQGAKQFELYTEKKAPVDAMGQVLLDWLNNKS